LLLLLLLLIAKVCLLSQASVRRQEIDIYRPAVSRVLIKQQQRQQHDDDDDDDTSKGSK